MFTVVEKIVTQILFDKDVTYANITLETKIRNDLGFNSLDLAQLIALMEQETDRDPFTELSVTNIVTIGDLCNAYT